MNTKIIKLLLGATILPVFLTSCTQSDHKHEWGEVTYTWTSDYASCTASRVCLKDSSHTESETSKSTYKVIDEAKCKQNGLGRYTATFKNRAFTTQTHDSTISPLNHDYQFDSFTWNGYTAKAKYVCTHDSNHVEYYNATVTSEITTSPTCDNTGIKTYTATYSTHSDTKTQVLSSLGHDWGEVTYELVEGTDNQMTAKRVCSRDNTHVQEETVTGTYQEITPADCENNGVGRYTFTFTNTAFVTQTHDVTIKKLNHDWGEPVYELIDKDEMVARSICKNDSSHIAEETVLGKKEIIVAPTEESEGLARYTFTFNDSMFETQTNDVVLHKLPYGSNPRFSDDNKTVIYGLYPQTYVSNKDLISELNDLYPEDNGWYYYNENYYMKNWSTTYNDATNYSFDDGTLITKYKSYWFKCEPIEWTILSSNGDEYHLLANKLLDSHKYDSLNKNNYMNSSIRDWLNDDFYEKAFQFKDSPIQVTKVDNSAPTTDNNTNPYACDSTEDKVFLLSFKDYTNPDYGFDKDDKAYSDTRYCKTTDYTRTTGACMSLSKSTIYNGHYWTRSPNSGNSHYAAYVRTDGVIHYDNNVSYSYLCVRPSIVINVENKLPITTTK